MLDIKALDSIEDRTPLIDLPKTRMTALQRGLAICGYPVGVVDGLFGPKTRNSFAELVEDNGFGDPALVSEQAADHLKARAKALRKILDAPAGSAEQVKERIAEMFHFIGLTHKAHKAYGLATAKWETAHTFQPVREAFWLSEGWRQNNFRYFPYYGRGYVQLTWESNYELYSSILGLDLHEDPDLALRHDVALFVLGHGMKLGTFTGRPLERFVFRNHTDFVNARRVINGTDKAREIAALAESFLDEV